MGGSSSTYEKLQEEVYAACKKIVKQNKNIPHYLSVIDSDFVALKLFITLLKNETPKYFTQIFKEDDTIFNEELTTKNGAKFPLLSDVTVTKISSQRPQYAGILRTWPFIARQLFLNNNKIDIRIRREHNKIENDTTFIESEFAEFSAVIKKLFNVPDNTKFILVVKNSKIGSRNLTDNGIEYSLPNLNTLNFPGIFNELQAFYNKKYIPTLDEACPSLLKIIEFENSAPLYDTSKYYCFDRLNLALYYMTFMSSGTRLPQPIALLVENKCPKTIVDNLQPMQINLLENSKGKLFVQDMDSDLPKESFKELIETAIKNLTIKSEQLTTINKFLLTYIHTPATTGGYGVFDAATLNLVDRNLVDSFERIAKEEYAPIKAKIEYHRKLRRDDLARRGYTI